MRFFSTDHTIVVASRRVSLPDYTGFVFIPHFFHFRFFFFPFWCIAIVCLSFMFCILLLFMLFFLLNSFVCFENLKILLRFFFCCRELSLPQTISLSVVFCIAYSFIVHFFGNFCYRVNSRTNWSLWDRTFWINTGV